MQHTLVQRMLSRIPHVNIPNNPRNIKKERDKYNYFHVSTKVVTYVQHGVEKQAIVGITYRKNNP